jgi:hypothetical protein
MHFSQIYFLIINALTRIHAKPFVSSSHFLRLFYAVFIKKYSIFILLAVVHYAVFLFHLIPAPFKNKNGVFFTLRRFLFTDRFLSV